MTLGPPQICIYILNKLRKTSHTQNISENLPHHLLHPSTIMGDKHKSHGSSSGGRSGGGSSSKGSGNKKESKPKKPQVRRAPPPQAIVQDTGKGTKVVRDRWGRPYGLLDSSSGVVHNTREVVASYDKDRGTVSRLAERMPYPQPMESHCYRPEYAETYQKRHY